MLKLYYSLKLKIISVAKNIFPAFCNLWYSLSISPMCSLNNLETASLTLTFLFLLLTFLECDFHFGQNVWNKMEKCSKVGQD